MRSIRPLGKSVLPIQKASLASIVSLIAWQIRLLLTVRALYSEDDVFIPKRESRGLPKVKTAIANQNLLLAGHISNVSLGILTHLKTTFPSEDMIENQLRSLGLGRDSSAFLDVFVFYDATDVPDEYHSAGTNELYDKWIAFSMKMDQLQSEGLVSKYIPLKRDSQVPAAVGSRDVRGKDAAMYALYQYLIEECQTAFCAFLTHDILAHEGGGLMRAVHALEADESLVFAVPPLAAQNPNWNRTNDRQLRDLFARFDGTRPYHTNLGIIDQQKPPEADVVCTSKRGPISTRYLVASPGRFKKSIPFSPVPDNDDWFENHKGLSALTALVECPMGSGYLIHPPPWHKGTQLFESCGDISKLQKAVDNPNYLVVDGFNNMVQENWTSACQSYAEFDKHTG